MKNPLQGATATVAMDVHLNVSIPAISDRLHLRVAHPGLLLTNRLNLQVRWPSHLHVKNEKVIEPGRTPVFACAAPRLIRDATRQVELGPGWYDERPVRGDLSALEGTFNPFLLPSVLFAQRFLEGFSIVKRPLWKGVIGSSSRVRSSETCDLYVGNGPHGSAGQIYLSVEKRSRLIRRMAQFHGDIELVRVDLIDWTLGVVLDDAAFEIPRMQGVPIQDLVNRVNSGTPIYKLR